jgi:hypothetical protein
MIAEQYIAARDKAGDQNVGRTMSVQGLDFGGMEHCIRKGVLFGI